MKSTADVRTSVSVRTCSEIFFEEEKCQKVNEQGIAGTVCTCNTDLCNSSTVMVGNFAA